MKHCSSLLLVVPLLVAWTASALGAPTSSSVNLVSNPGFESSPSQLEGWTGTSAPAADADGQTGTVAALLGNDDNISTELAQTIALNDTTPGACFAIQFWAHVSATYNPEHNELEAALLWGDQPARPLTKNTASSTQLPIKNGTLHAGENSQGWEQFAFYQCPPPTNSSNETTTKSEITLQIRGNGYLIDNVSVSIQYCPDAAEFEAFLRELMVQHNLPSLAVAAVKEGVVVCAAAVGTRVAYRDDLPVSITDRYHIGSDGKGMTALLAGIAVDEGKLTWDTRVADVFPEFVPLMTEEFKLVNLTQLLSHSSGIGQAGDIEVFSELVPDLDCGNTERNLEPMRQEVLKFVANHTLSTFPGTAWSYSNSGYMVAGHLIERVFGDSYERLLTARIFDGLHLSTAGLGCQVALGRIDAPVGHVLSDNNTLLPFFAGPWCDNPALMAPAGIVHLSLLDFAFWAGWNAGQGKRGPHIASRATIIKTHTGIIVANPPNPPPGTPPPGLYAMGWGYRKMDWAPYPLLYHAGSNTKNLANIWVDVEKDFAMVSLTNVAGIGAENAFIKVAERLYTELSDEPL